MPQRGSELLTCEIHLLPFSEHLVAAYTSGTGRVVVFPSCLWKPGHEVEASALGLLCGPLVGEPILVALLSLHCPVVGWEASQGHPQPYESLARELVDFFMGPDENSGHVLGHVQGNQRFLFPHPQCPQGNVILTADIMSPSLPKGPLILVITKVTVSTMIKRDIDR